MTTVTLTAKSYADLELFEALAKRLGASMKINNAEDRKRTAAVKAFRELAAESRAAAIKAGYVTEEQVNALVEECIKEVREETGEVRLWGKNAHRD